MPKTLAEEGPMDLTGTDVGAGDKTLAKDGTGATAGAEF